MANIWLIEGSQVVQRMVEIALDGLPAKLSFAQHVSNLIKDNAPSPHLVICAEYILDAQDTSHANSYLVQIEYLAQQGYQCPVVILQNQTTSQVEPCLLAEGLPLVASLRKPFKTFALMKVICDALALRIPHEEVYSMQSRVIPLARPKASVATPPAIPVVSTQSAAMPAEASPVPPEAESSSSALMDDATTPPASIETTPPVAKALEGSSHLADPAPAAMADPAPPAVVEMPAPPSVADASAPPLMEDATTPPPMIEAPALPTPEESSAPPALAPPVLSVLESNPVAQSLEPTDLSPPPRLEQTEQNDAEVSHEHEEEIELEKQPSAEDSFQFDFENLGQNEDQASSEYEVQENTSSSPLPDELQDDWLDESGATVNVAALSAHSEDTDSSESKENESLNEEAEAISSTDSSVLTNSEGHESLPPTYASDSFESHWLQELKLSVETVSDQALEVVQKAIHTSQAVEDLPQHTLSNHEMRVLIERIAWEVVPSLASVELRDRIQQMTNK